MDFADHCPKKFERVLEHDGLILLERLSRVFATAAQQNPVLVRTMIAVDPGNDPSCHQVPAAFTAHPDTGHNQP